MDTNQWLTREQIDRVIEGLSADDLIESGMAGETDQTKAIGAAARAFNAAAARLGISNGTTATAVMRATDLRYFAEALKAYMDIDAPKLKPLEDSPDSAVTGV
jgi:hypothetical protein